MEIKSDVIPPQAAHNVVFTAANAATLNDERVLGMMSHQ
jgi:hypothetical protein